MSAKKEQKGSMEMDNKAAEGEEQEIERVERQKQRGGKKHTEKEREGERVERRKRSPFTRGGRARGEAPRRQMKIMRTFLSGKIYKIVPVLLKFKISSFFPFFSLPTLFLPPTFPCPVFFPPLPAAQPYYQL